MTALAELEAAVRAAGHLEDGEAIPRVPEANLCIDGGRLPTDLGVYTVDGSARALSLRYCDLAALPESVGEVPGLRHVDLTGNPPLSVAGRVPSLSGQPHA